MSTCNRLDLQTLRSQPVILKISPITGSYELVVVKVAMHLIKFHIEVEARQLFIRDRP